MDYVVVADTSIKGCGTFTIEAYSQDQAKDWVIRHHAPPSQQPPDQFNNLKPCFNQQQVIDNIGKLTGLFMEAGDTTQVPEMSVGEEALVLPQYYASGIFGTPNFCNPVFGGGFGGGGFPGGGFNPNPPDPQQPQVPDFRLVKRTV